MVGPRIGYVRVSTLDQNERRQPEGQVLDRVFMDKASGRDTARHVLEYATKKGIAFIPFFPLATGKLASAEGPLGRISARLGATPSQLALAWLLKRSPVVLPIPGTSSLEHLKQNLLAAKIELTRTDYEELSNLA